MFFDSEVLPASGVTISCYQGFRPDAVLPSPNCTTAAQSVLSLIDPKWLTVEQAPASNYTIPLRYDQTYYHATVGECTAVFSLHNVTAPVTATALSDP